MYQMIRYLCTEHPGGRQGVQSSDDKHLTSLQLLPDFDTFPNLPRKWFIPSINFNRPTIRPRKAQNREDPWFFKSLSFKIGQNYNKIHIIP